MSHRQDLLLAICIFSRPVLRMMSEVQPSHDRRLTLSSIGLEQKGGLEPHPCFEHSSHTMIIVKWAQCNDCEDKSNVVIFVGATAFAVCQQPIPFPMEPWISRHLSYTRVKYKKQTTTLLCICKLPYYCSTEDEISTAYKQLLH